jgi:hypothetical protein
MSPLSTRVVALMATSALTIWGPRSEAPGVPAPDHWCATPRRHEPLVRDAIRLVTASDTSSWGIERKVYGIRRVPRASIVVSRDDEVCRQAAMAYSAIREMPDPALPRQVVPVVVVQVDLRYLVDDLRSRRQHWEVEVFDIRWRHIGAYGGGA